MEHKQVRQLLVISPREWSDTERRQVEVHLRVCPDCTALAREYAMQERLLAALPRFSLSPENRQAVIVQIQRKSSRIRLSARLYDTLGIVAGVVGIGFLAIILFLSRYDATLGTASDATPGPNSSTPTESLLPSGDVTTASPFATAPTRTPAPRSNADRYEPNDSFDTAVEIALNVEYSDLNFIPKQSSVSQPASNDFFKVHVTPGLQVTCETFDLAPGADTIMILYDSDLNGIGGNDDIDRAGGNSGSRVTYYSTYKGLLYILVGNARYSDTTLTYSLRCITP